MKSTFATLLLLAASSAFGAAHHKESIPVVDVQISDLVANPGFYNNAVVRVRGAAVLRFEAEFICESADDIDRENGHCLQLAAVTKNGRLGPLDPALYHDKIVVLIGVFDKDYGARTSLPGAIAPIRVMPIGKHTKGDIPPPPPEPSANNSFKPRSLRGRGVVWQIVTTPRPQSAPA